MQYQLSVTFIAIGVFIGSVLAETHIVQFTNNCGFGTPTLLQNGNILSQGATVEIEGALISAIAYLQTGGCGLNGEGCTLIETTLVNPTSPGSGSSTDISLIPPHAFSVTSGFGYFGGCDGAGADCTGPDCSTAFHSPGDTGVQVACQSDNVNLAITFCD
ncbi:glycopeptide [Dichomitus squalens LYAD-421 SS1]|uniref:Glycopeptide n=2 Tax=Dichomitus squalens TaxID=114155 RepID=A0A4Q9MJY1_9APHY|nr:glycopeptide [Dichomitus squalens LYAD-421 SS1]EJF59182.1 glycopeptide [Dichomitus squalens LYAD-421 SS1]TBU27809.1 glycopeptide [Dichomitus squalens]